MCSEKRYVKNLTACRGGPGPVVQVKLLSLKQNSGALFLLPLTQKNVFFWTLFTPGELQRPCGRDGGGFNMSHSSLFLRVTKHFYCFYCLIWDWGGRKKTGRCSSPQAADFRNEENRGWELQWKGTRMHACIHTHTAYTLTHMFECVARSHGRCCYMQCKHVWGCVLNTHYRGLGKLWERLGEKTNKPHRVAERGGGSPSVIQVQ